MEIRRTAALLLACLLAAVGCGPGDDSGGADAMDVHSHARPDEVRVAHLDLDWTVSFEEKVLDGTAILHLEHAGAKQATLLHLDTRGLEVLSVDAGTGGSFRETHWTFGEADAILGRALTVDLFEGTDQVRIAYRTSPEASGLQWLDPEQTAGGTRPFLYSQSQAIHARSWIPCQDSPAVRLTFEAVVRVPPGVRPVMAAQDVSREGEELDGLRVFRFSMQQPIPSYLLALAVGELEFREVGPRTGVWAEPPVVEEAAWEFADMERMLETSEGLYGPYAWGRYDILVVPPAFPYGGMENPRLTFATPTVLAGDRSLVSLVAHELAHSWSGNLVTNATWSDFWLNEGFTTYITYRLMEAIYGRDRAEMEALLGRRELDRELAEDLAGSPGDQVLHIDLAGRDPDAGMTGVAYEKGALFLRLLEETYGRDVFDAFLAAWFRQHAFRSVTTAEFRRFLDENLIQAHQPLGVMREPDVEYWIEGPGLPGDAPMPRTDALNGVGIALSLLLSQQSMALDLNTSQWTIHHWLHFLRSLPEEMTMAMMAQLDDAFDLTGTGNSEVLAQWLLLCIRNDYRGADDRLEEFLVGMGRRKFLEPLYRELVKTPEGRERAREIYATARPRYHSITRRAIDEIVQP